MKFFPVSLKSAFVKYLICAKIHASNVICDNSYSFIHLFIIKACNVQNFIFILLIFLSSNIYGALSIYIYTGTFQCVWYIVFNKIDKRKEMCEI